MINISLLNYTYNRDHRGGGTCIPPGWVRSGHPVQITFRNATGKVMLVLCLLLYGFEQHDLFILKKFTQNNVKRKVNEFVKAPEKKLK